MSMDYSRTDIIKVKDLEPAADGKPQALYECNICGRYECVSEVDLEQIENIIEGGV